MWCLSVAGIPDFADLLSPMDSCTGANHHRVRRHVCVQRVDTLAKFDDREVPVHLIERQVLRQRAWRLVAQMATCGYHLTVRHRQDRLTVNFIVLHDLRVTREDSAGIVDLFPVDGETLRKIEASIERQQCSYMPDAVTTPICRGITGALQRRLEHSRLSAIHPRLCDTHRDIATDPRRIAGNQM